MNNAVRYEAFTNAVLIQVIPDEEGGYQTVTSLMVKDDDMKDVLKDAAEEIISALAEARRKN